MMIIPPILVYDGGDFSFFNNIQDVERYLEPFAIEEGEVQVFDSQRQTLKFIVQQGTWFNTVECFGVEEEKSEVDLHRALANYIAQRFDDKAYLDAPWDNLISFVSDQLLQKNRKTHK